MRHYCAAALIAFLAAAGCDSVLGINEFPADDGGSDSTVATPDAGGPPADPVVSISVGGTEACAVTAGGALYCWGPGPIGDGTTSARWQATRIAKDNAGQSLPPIVSVSIGGAHACATPTSASGGLPYCWGNNEYGQLGTGHLAEAGVIVQAPQLVAVPPISSLGTIACGAFHTCGADPDGGLWCWGSNSFGELGHPPGADGDLAISNAHVTEANPVPKLSSLGAVGTALGDGFTCGLTAPGAGLACVGTNSALQLDSLDAGSFSSTPLKTLTNYNITSIAAGAKHACAFDKNDGRALCWGDNSSGQLAYGPTIAADASDVAGFLLPDTFDAVVAGGNASCALTMRSEVECWGANEVGQLGHDPASDTRLCPGNGGPCSDLPMWIPTVFKPLNAISMGPTAACVLQNDRTVWCWGSAALVGNGVAATDASTAQFTPVQVQGLPPP